MRGLPVGAGNDARGAKGMGLPVGAGNDEVTKGTGLPVGAGNDVEYGSSYRIVRRHNDPTQKDTVELS